MEHLKNLNLTLDDDFLADPTLPSFVRTYFTENSIILTDIYVDAHKVDKIIKRLENAMLPISLNVNDASHLGFIVIDNISSRTTSSFAVLIRLMEGRPAILTVIGSPPNVALVDTAIHDLVQLDSPEGDYDIHIQNFYRAGSKLRTATTTKLMSDFEYVSDALYPKINVPDMVASYIASTENILILTGEPGTGKTTFIKKVMASIAAHSEDDVTVAYIKDQALLEDNETWTMLSNGEHDVLVFDDLDDSLGSRKKGGNNSFVAQLLSFSDGIFDKTTKIIITTNRPIDDIDPAVIRPGRCFDILRMPALTREEAISVWEETYELAIDSFITIFGDADTITQAYLSSEAKSLLANKPKTYLRDQSISIRKQFMK